MSERERKVQEWENAQREAAKNHGFYGVAQIEEHNYRTVINNKCLSLPMICSNLSKVKSSNSQVLVKVLASRCEPCLSQLVADRWPIYLRP